MIDRYEIPEHHHLENEYHGRERSYEMDRYARDRYARDISDRFGAMGPLCDEGRPYRSRPGPYDRPSRAGGRSSSYERW